MVFRRTWMLVAAGLLAPAAATAQSLHSANWVFGTRCRVNWNPADTTARPTASLNPNIAAGEGVATFSDPLTGGMLLYTDGITAWNGADARVSTAALGGNPSSIHSGVIVPVPAQPGRYYVFGNSPSASTGPISYTIFDMRTAPGTQVGSPVQIPGSAVTNETLVAVPHTNRRDYWLISTSTTAVIVIPVTSTGVGAAMTMGATVASSAWNGLAVAPSGREFAVFTAPNVRRYPFDAATGTVGTPAVIAITGSSSAYGAAYSSDSTKLYLTDDIGGAGDTPGRMYQVDLAVTPPAVVTLGQAAGTYVGALALGIDGRVYGACINNTDAGGRHYLSVVDNPNAAGTAANYTRLGLQLASGCTGQLGLPTQVSAFSTVIEDSDRDGVEDGADVDADDDGALDVDELPAAAGRDLSRDTDFDGVPDFRDPSFVTCADAAPMDGFCDALPREYDLDTDGVANHLDLDADGDGVFDIEETGNGALDRNADGRPDALADGDRDGLAAAFDRNDMDRTATASNATLRNSDAAVPAGEGSSDTAPDLLDADDDGDGVPTRVERALEGTTPGDADMVPAYLDRDSDGDTVPDSVERGADGMMPANSDMGGTSDRVDLLDTDSDNDCVLDSDPREAGAARTNPALPSATADANCAFPTPVCNRATGACSAEADTDMDGLPDRVEGLIGTNPMNPDTDGDGIRDGAEVGTGPGYTTRDSDMDGMIDFARPDDDGDGVPTRAELGAGGGDAAQHRRDDRGADGRRLAATSSTTTTTPCPTRDELGPGGFAMPRNTDASVRQPGLARPGRRQRHHPDRGGAALDGSDGPRTSTWTARPSYRDLDSDGDMDLDRDEVGSDAADAGQHRHGRAAPTGRTSSTATRTTTACPTTTRARTAPRAPTRWPPRPTPTPTAPWGWCATASPGNCGADGRPRRRRHPRHGRDPHRDQPRQPRHGRRLHPRRRRARPGPTTTPRDSDMDGMIDARDPDDDNDTSRRATSSARAASRCRATRT
jgi:hypothetical protein